MAPSPTGPFHIGSARTALFNYLFAKKYGGKFIVRIEDTDLERSKVEWEDNIAESLAWLGLDYDEGPDKVGSYGPYRQSERREIYQKYIERLLAEQKAYYCFCSAEDLEAQKQYAFSQGLPAVYSGKCRSLGVEEVQEKIKKGEESVIRFKTPHQKVVFKDLLRGKIEYDAAIFGDTVIAKNTTAPLYNLACVADDFEMKISQVIRGEEHISNTPRQILLAEALGLKSPEFLHLPLILNSQRAKLSKRDPSIAAKVADYQENGYLPEALVNFIALLGWNPGDEREVFSMEELIAEFSVEKLQKAGAVFNVQKLDWLNGFYIRKAPLERITELCIPYLTSAGLIAPIWGQAEVLPLVYSSDFTILKFRAVDSKEEFSFKQIELMVSLYQERLKKISEIRELADFFFKEKLDYPQEILNWKKSDPKDLPVILKLILKILEPISERDWNKEKIESIIMAEADKMGDRGKLLWPLRVALSGKQASAGPFEIAAVLGQEKSLKRLRLAQELTREKYGSIQMDQIF